MPVSTVHSTYCAPNRQVSDTPYVLGWPGMAVSDGSLVDDTGEVAFVREIASPQSELEVLLTQPRSQHGIEEAVGALLSGRARVVGECHIVTPGVVGVKIYFGDSEGDGNVDCERCRCIWRIESVPRLFTTAMTRLAHR